MLTASLRASKLCLTGRCVRPGCCNQQSLTKCLCLLQAVSVAMPGLSCDGILGVDEQSLHDVRDPPSLHLQVHKAG